MHSDGMPKKFESAKRDGMKQMHSNFITMENKILWHANKTVYPVHDGEHASLKAA